jgi:hypothetical protein
MRAMHRIQNSEDINEFVQLWHMIRNTSLSDQEDKIIWGFTANRKYTAKSTYAVQFTGTFADDEWNRVRHAKVEEKCKFFCWLFLQNKVWTVDRITKHGGSTNIICQLCCTQSKSILHMLAECSYSKLVWEALSVWIGTNF